MFFAPPPLPLKTLCVCIFWHVNEKNSLNTKSFRGWRPLKNVDSGMRFLVKSLCLGVFSFRPCNVDFPDNSAPHRRSQSAAFSIRRFGLQDSHAWESAKVSHKRVFALLTPEIRGWNMAQMLPKTSVRALGLSTDEREHPFVWYLGLAEHSSTAMLMRIARPKHLLRWFLRSKP